MVYAMLGILVGFIGSRLNVWGLQQFLSIAAGIMILFFAALQFKIAIRHRWMQSAHAFIQQRLSYVLRAAKGPFAFFLIGNLNALLPCGLVYVGLTGALATGNIMQAGWLMFFFGLGTMPAMISVMLLRNQFSFSFRRKLNRAVPYVVSVMAILLILRGMNLGIAYISPAKTMDTLTMPSCHNAR
jgi:sulfite exporter TauE/SafE